MDQLEWWHGLAAWAAAVVVYAVLAWIFPALLDPLVWLIAKCWVKLHVYGRDKIPPHGPVLIVSNHVSYLDWLFLWVACPRRLTFVLYAGFRRHPVLRFLLSYVRHRVITIDNRSTAPHAMAESLETIARELAAGRALLLFPEGRLTRNGQMRPFHRGVELILRQAAVPVAVIPTCLWNVWGMMFTHKHQPIRPRWPEEFRRRIAVYFATPLPADASITAIRAAVVEAMADCAQAQSEYIIPVHSNFVRKGAKLSNLRRPAFVDVATGTERVLTWPKALVGAWSLAGWLKRRLGVESNVGIWLPTGLGSAFCNIALALLRRTAVNLNYTAGMGSVHSALRQANVKLVLTARRFESRVPLELPPDVQKLYLEDALAGISGLAKLWRLALVLLLPGWFLDRCVLRTRRFGWDQPLTIMFSSGSTGDPKGVMLSLRNISSNADSFQKGVNFTTSDRMLCALPYFHSFGYTVCLWAPASIGMIAVFYPDPRAAKEVGELCRRWACTIILGTATFVRFYLRRCDPDDFRASRLFICGAEKLPVSLAEEFQAKFGVLPLEGYGCTELSPGVSVNLPDVMVQGVSQKANLPGSVGQPLPGIVVRACDVETHQPLPPGEDGMLWVKGPNVMLGYLHQPEKTASVVREGWYATGDIGHVTSDGFVRITGRLSRFAKIAGEMVPLERLEDELHDALAAQGERMLAVAAVPDLRRGERLVVLHLPDTKPRLRDALESLRKRGAAEFVDTGRARLLPG